MMVSTSSGGNSFRARPGVAAVFQTLILLEEKHQRRTHGGGRVVPIFFRDSELVGRQHGVRLARMQGDVY